MAYAPLFNHCSGSERDEYLPSVFVDIRRLLQPGEVQPGIQLAEVLDRRQRLTELLPNNAIAIVPGGRQVFKAGIVPYPFRQSADFRYLVGSSEPGVAIFHKVGDSDEAVHMCVHLRAELQLTLLQESRSIDRVVWDGPQTSPAAAVNLFSARDTKPFSAQCLHDVLSAASGPNTSVFLDQAETTSLVAAVVSTWKQEHSTLHRPAELVKPLRPTMDHLRWCKSPGEQKLMRISAHAASAALVECIKQSGQGQSEAHLAALFEFQCKLSGASDVSFPPVVGSGKHACTIHYSRNDQLLRQGDLVLMDAGCEHSGYSSDVTRTWPVGGHFTRPQQIVYEHVLAAHRQIMSQVKPGVSLAELHSRSVEILKAACVDMGVLHNGSCDHRAVYPHSIGHWLGINVHDCATVPLQRPLEPGVVMAIEPGLYFDTSAHVPPEFRGIGVRIEDVVLVTKEGAEVLSAHAPSSLEHVEALAGTCHTALKGR